MNSAIYCHYNLDSNHEKLDEPEPHTESLHDSDTYPDLPSPWPWTCPDPDRPTFCLYEPDHNLQPDPFPNFVPDPKIDIAFTLAQNITLIWTLPLLWTKPSPSVLPWSGPGTWASLSEPEPNFLTIYVETLCLVVCYSLLQYVFKILYLYVCVLFWYIYDMIYYI